MDKTRGGHRKTFSTERLPASVEEITEVTNSTSRDERRAIRSLRKAAVHLGISSKKKMKQKGDSHKSQKISAESIVIPDSPHDDSPIPTPKSSPNQSPLLSPNISPIADTHGTSNTDPQASSSTYEIITLLHAILLKVDKVEERIASLEKKIDDACLEEVQEG